jgi:hypothetical protein
MWSNIKVIELGKSERTNRFGPIVAPSICEVDPGSWPVETRRLLGWAQTVLGSDTSVTAEIAPTFRKVHYHRFPDL